MNTKVLREFLCRVEENSMGKDVPVLMVSYYNQERKYIGSPEDFKRLVMDRKIFPETYSDNNVCSIGKSSKDGKWYGWSHRAIFGFKIGDVVKEGDCCASSGYTEEYLETHTDDLPLPIGFTAKTEEDCKKMAIAFANSVS